VQPTRSSLGPRRRQDHDRGKHRGGAKEMSQDFKKGDRVLWKSRGGNAEGEVLQTITDDTELAGRKVWASKDDPQYLVRSDKSGGEAVHKPSALRKRG
jgi:hypothetical protein